MWGDRQAPSLSFSTGARGRQILRRFAGGCCLLFWLLCGCPSQPAPQPPALKSAQPSGPPPATPNASRPTANRDELLQWAHQALGYLENEKYTQAEAELEKILAFRPRDRFAVRNLAICRELLYQQSGTNREASASVASRRRAEDAVALWITLEPQSAIPHLLRARIAQQAGDASTAVDSLQQAVRLEPDNPVAWWELYAALGGGQSLSADQWNALPASQREAILAAGQRLAELQPENWFFLKDWIFDLAVAGRAELQPTLERLRPQVAPLAPFIEQDVRVNPLKFLDTAIEATAAGNFPAAINALRPLVNVLLRPEAPYDQGLLKKHSLEFLLRDYDEAFYAEWGRPAVSVPTLPVRFTPRDLAWSEAPQLPVLDALWADVDRDGWFDLAVLSERELRIYRQTAEGSWQLAWEPVTLADNQQWTRMLAADLDHDAQLVASSVDKPPSALAQTNLSPADPDFVLFGPAGLGVLENQRTAEGTRRLVPIGSELPWSNLRDVTAAGLLDLDHDGDLDLISASPRGVQLWAQRGRLRFVEVTERVVLPPAGTVITAMAVLDWDRDVDLDVLLATSTGLRLMENLRHGRFRDHALGKEFDALTDATQLKVRDLDGNGAFDLVASSPRGVSVVWMEPPATGAGSSGVKNSEIVSDQPSPRCALWDYDNDGLVDVVATTPQGVSIFRQTEPGKLSPSEDLLHDPEATWGLPADLDADGDLDLWTGPVLRAWQNDGGNAHHWMTVSLFAQQEKGSARADSKRVNHEGWGSLLELRAGDRYQAAIVEGQSTHFGLGPRDRADLLRVLWTNGVPNSYLAPPVDTQVFEEQLPIGSCPYLYTWDGQRFVFCTDLLWNAPLGLRFAEGTVAPWREWEYLKIDGRQLQPRDGCYELRITEELWEAAYFDQVKLYAVDHPADWQVYTNEKVGPAELAEPMLHGVHQPRPPVAARDPHGRDLLPGLLAADGRYVRAYDQRLASGLVNDHFLELDLGDLRGAQRITLFLTGWLFPTDTSLNVQFSQQPHGPRPRPPSLWTPDAQGAWREVRPFMGFIGGKTKTIAVDVSEVFTPGDYRLRIATNMEFAWDAVFFTVDEPPLAFPPSADRAVAASPASPPPNADPAEMPRTASSLRLTVHELELIRADLHYRGFSQAVHHPGDGPETYDYNRVSTEPRWPPLSGTFTRYGDVRPFIEQRDDRLVVFGAGDELELAFRVPDQPVPDGWVRDFVLYNVGWDKDAVLNTLYGQTVEPLPFAGMSTYSYAEQALRPQRDTDHADLRTYQTRRQLPSGFWNLVRRPLSPGNVWPRSRWEDTAPPP